MFGDVEQQYHSLLWELHISTPLSGVFLCLSFFFAVIKNTMMNAYFFQMNNLKELAADKSQDCTL